MLHIDPFAIRELLGPDAAPGRRAITGEHGVVLPALTDHHVHLHLIDEHELAPHGIAAVVDLGGDPLALARRPREGLPAPGVCRGVPHRTRRLPGGAAMGDAAPSRVKSPIRRGIRAWPAVRRQSSTSRRRAEHPSSKWCSMQRPDRSSTPRR